MASRATFPKVCVALGLPNADALLAQARHEIEQGERFLEFRLDYLKERSAGPAIIRDVLKQHPDAVILATCRRKENRGHFDGLIEEQINVLTSAINAGARAVDLEIESAEVSLPALSVLRTSTFVVSYHNWENTPALDGVVKRLSKIEAAIYKLVTTAKKPSDWLRVLNCIKPAARAKWVLLSMGESGLPSRILAPAVGCCYTYAAPACVEGTAAGQLAARTLRHLYRVEKISRSARIYGVVADPVKHSISPAVHNRGFQAKRLDAVYVPFLVAPGQFRDFMKVCDELPVHGLSVTIPHKQRIMRYLDTIDPLARRIGAVNTAWKKAGKWRGTNTDIYGVTGPLARKLKLAKSTVLVAGNGGAARSAVFSLMDAGASVTITGRSMEKVKTLARLTGAEAVASDQLGSRYFDAFVNATPLGMHPKVDGCFFDGEIPADLVFDMVYNPAQTLLLKRAEEQGCDVIPGLDMFMEQAARQFEIFTGEQAPLAVMQRAAVEALGLSS
ncbi:MAG TPA: shikimate dehydrogenase [Bryobacteraceae bacterium]|nr:shikimate dehydrogenase [Bryobacteraceae bacterium]